MPLPVPAFRDPNSRSKNPYEGRWRWWYVNIADFMLRNPTAKLGDCAKELGRALGTIQMITTTDSFKTYFAQRQEEHSRAHDAALRNKLTQVAEKSLDATLTALEKQGDKVPLKLLTEINVSVLDRLGFAPKTGPQVAVNVDASRNSQTVVVSGVTPQALEEARAALRLAQQRNADRPEILLPASDFTTSEAAEGEEPVHEVFDGAPMGKD